MTSTRIIRFLHRELNTFLAGVESTYQAGLEAYGVESVAVVLGSYTRLTKSVTCTMQIKKRAQLSFVKEVRSWQLAVDEGALLHGGLIEKITSVVPRADLDHVCELFKQKVLKEKNPGLFDALALDYAARGLPNTATPDGEWLLHDLTHAVDLFQFVK